MSSGKTRRVLGVLFVWRAVPQQTDTHVKGAGGKKMPLNREHFTERGT